MPRHQLTHNEVLEGGRHSHMHKKSTAQKKAEKSKGSPKPKAPLKVKKAK